MQRSAVAMLAQQGGGGGGFKVNYSPDWSLFTEGGDLAQLGDPAGKLMPNHDWRLEPVAGPAVPLPDVKIGPTDTGVMNLNQRFSRSAGGYRHLAENNAGTGGLFDQGAHGGGI